MPPLTGSSPSIYRDDPRARAAYSEGAGIYRIVPQAVAVPQSMTDLLALVHWAARDHLPLVPRGAGSAVTGSSVGSGIVVDLARMGPRVLVLDPDQRTARTSAWTRAGELQEAATTHGLRLPPNPSSTPFATLGGMVSTNASGSRSLRYGSVRRWVQGLDVVTAEGDQLRLHRGQSSDPAVAAVQRFEEEVAPEIRRSGEHIRHTFPATAKNSAGYALDAWLESGDLLDLFIGAEGTLGIITEIEWALDHVPPARAGLQVALGSLDDLTRAVEALLPLRPSALELLDRSFLDLARGRDPGVAPPSTEAMLLLELEGSDPTTLRGTVGDAVRRVRDLALDVITGVTEPDLARVWDVRHAASPIIADLPEGRRSLQVIEDACVPLQHMAGYIALVRHSAAELGIPVVIFGHAGDGNIHVNLLPDITRPGWENDVAELYDRVTMAVIRLQGTLSGEHGDGRIRAGTLRQRFGHEIVDLFQRTREAFDPQGILNPGVKLPQGHPEPLAGLKTGVSAAPIPDDIAAALREIERRGDYTRDRLALADV